MPLGDPGGYARGQGGGAGAGRLGGASPRGMWAQGMAARPMNAGPQNMGGSPVNVANRFNPGRAAGMRRVSPPFQKFQNNWGPRTAGFQAPGRPVGNVNPNRGRPAFAALPPRAPKNVLTAKPVDRGMRLR